ncbi:choice-of-anchor P family protein [Streptomyces krungchingensis]|uniref:choice-of-anchor P family protein n=1 Tax=Streptomyces krungchingensis TaxID=1565034 RepID=UPI003CE971C1
MRVLHGRPRTPTRTTANSRGRRQLSSALLVVLLGLLAALVAPATARADPGDPNPNMIDWTVVDSFRGTAGNDIPLREGQSDCKAPQCNPPVDGFGRRHILEHGVVPDHDDIQETVGTEGFCVPAPDNRVICTNTDASLVVVYVTHNDPRSGDGRPFGIITAYYFLPCFQAAACPGPEQPHKVDTALTYTGADSAVNGSPARLSAKLTNDFGTPVGERAVRFALGTGATQQTCTGTTTASGTATCTIDPVDQPQGASNAVPVAVSFGGDDDYNPSGTSAELGLTSPTDLDYTGVTHLANGTSARLAAELTDFRGDAVAGRTVRFALGTGDDEQTCTGTTSDTGTAACTVASVDQPLTDAATVPLRASFAGDAGYLASDTSAQLKLQYATGRAYGMSAHVGLLGVPLLEIEPQPDTGTVRTADATATDTPCSAAYTSPLLSAQKLCPEVTTTLAPGRVTAVSTVAQARIGLPGVPVIEVSGLTATAASQCGKATGSTALTLKIAGVPVNVSGDPNTEIPLVGGGRLIVNEQVPSSAADSGVKVNGVHLVLPAGGGDVVLASADSAMHNCGD